MVGKFRKIILDVLTINNLGAKIKFLLFLSFFTLIIFFAQTFYFNQNFKKNYFIFSGPGRQGKFADAEKHFQYKNCLKVGGHSEIFECFKSIHYKFNKKQDLSLLTESTAVLKGVYESQVFKSGANCHVIAHNYGKYLFSKNRNTYNELLDLEIDHQSIKFGLANCLNGLYHGLIMQYFNDIKSESDFREKMSLPAKFYSEKILETMSAKTDLGNKSLFFYAEMLQGLGHSIFSRYSDEQMAIAECQNIFSKYGNEIVDICVGGVFSEGSLVALVSRKPRPVEYCESFDVRFFYQCISNNILVFNEKNMENFDAAFNFCLKVENLGLYMNCLSRTFSILDGKTLENKGSDFYYKLCSSHTKRKELCLFLFVNMYSANPELYENLVESTCSNYGIFGYLSCERFIRSKSNILGTYKLYFPLNNSSLLEFINLNKLGLD